MVGPQCEPQEGGEGNKAEKGGGRTITARPIMNQLTPNDPKTRKRDDEKAYGQELFVPADRAATAIAERHAVSANRQQAVAKERLGERPRTTAHVHKHNLIEAVKEAAAEIDQRFGAWRAGGRG